jgi:hypothetical protein
MSVIVDTSVWSLALRRNAPDSAIVEQLRTLIAADQVSIFGAIRQEILQDFALLSNSSGCVPTSELFQI